MRNRASIFDPGPLFISKREHVKQRRLAHVTVTRKCDTVRLLRTIHVFGAPEKTKRKFAELNRR